MNKNIAVQDIYLLSDVKMLFEQQNCIETIVLQPFRIFRQICENIAPPVVRLICIFYKNQPTLVYTVHCTVSGSPYPISSIPPYSILF